MRMMPPRGLTEGLRFTVQGSFLSFVLARDAIRCERSRIACGCL